MRWYSTPESAKNGEPTVLAICETILAVSMSIYLAIRFHSLRHILIGAVIAPLLLLRNERSVKIALNWMSSLARVVYWLHWFKRKTRPASNRFPFNRTFLTVLPLFIAAVSLIVKVGATLKVLLLYPKEAFQSIPVNWVRISLATDIAHVPELLPGIETENVYEFLVTLRWSQLARDKSVFVREWWFCGMLFGPALLYRYSLKSTSLIYFPLIWVIGWPKAKAESLPYTLDEITSSQIEKLKRWYGALVVLMTATPLVFSFHRQKMLSSFWGQPFFQYFIPVDEIDSWHITRMAAAIITFGLFFYAERTQRRSRNNIEANSADTISLLDRWGRVRMLCSLWTIGCGLFILAKTVDWSTFPRIRWLP